MDKIAVLFTMKTCPHCHEIKEMLDREGIDYVDRDIHEYEEDYDMFVEATGSDFVPAFILIEDFESEEPKSSLFVPERDFNDIQQGVSIIKEFYER